jgi:proline iminopeptidase
MSVYPEIEPYDHGMLDVSYDRLYWETCGNPQGQPALVLHGGPGSGCTRWHRRLFNPRVYRTVLFDQRGCGRSMPHASAPETTLTHNHTWNLVDDIERLRRHLHVEQWVILGGSWGSTLALAYAQEYPEQVCAMVLWGVTTGRRKEFDWLFRGGIANFFPDQWEKLCDAVPPSERDADIVHAYCRLLNHSEASIREQASFAWCAWESASPNWPPTNVLSLRFTDPSYRMAFARIVTHYVSHNAGLQEDALLAGAGRLSNIPGILINGRFDFQAPIGWAWDLKRAWPRAQLVIVEDAGHDAAHPGLSAKLVWATDSLSR